jgi:TetR/AcrR family acrAB operon transcriptional repressor
MAATKKDEQALATRERLIEAATQLFADRGYRDTSVQAIGAAAGISRGSIFWHFGSKEGLLLAVVERAFAEWESEVLVPDVGDAVGVEAIRRALDAHRRFLVDDSAKAIRLLFVLMFEALGPRPEHAQRFVDLHAHLRTLGGAWLAEGQKRGDVRDDVDPVAATTILVGTMGGVAYQYLLDPSLDLEQIYDDMADVLVDGLAARPR